MKKFFVLAGAAALSACGGTATDEEDVVVAEAPAEAMALNETSWTFTLDGTDLLESIDADGNYIADAGDEHFDHGTYEMVDGKHCFTSAMDDDGQVCWTMPATTAVGEGVEITSDSGEKLTVTRQEYEPLTMPS